MPPKEIIPPADSVLITTPASPALSCFQTTQAGDLRASTIAELPPGTTIRIDILPDHRLTIFRSELRRDGA